MENLGNFLSVEFSSCGIKGECLKSGNTENCAKCEMRGLWIFYEEILISPDGKSKRNAGKKKLPLESLIKDVIKKGPKCIEDFIAEVFGGKYIVAVSESEEFKRIKFQETRRYTIEGGNVIKVEPADKNLASKNGNNKNSLEERKRNGRNIINEFFFGQLKL